MTVMRASCEARVDEKARVEAGVRIAEDAGRRRKDIFTKGIGCGELVGRELGGMDVLFRCEDGCGGGGVCLTVAVGSRRGRATR
jgi:hypothetical protein